MISLNILKNTANTTKYGGSNETDWVKCIFGSALSTAAEDRAFQSG